MVLHGNNTLRRVIREGLSVVRESPSVVMAGELITKTSMSSPYENLVEETTYVNKKGLSGFRDRNAWEKSNEGTWYQMMFKR